MKLLTIPETAKKLSSCPRTVHRLIDSGKLPVVEITPSRRGRRINPSDLKQFMRGKACQSVSMEINGRSMSETAPLASELVNPFLLLP